MEKIVKLLHRKSCVVLTALCVLAFSTCRFPYTVKNARFKNEFLWVYAEKDFNFKNAGKVQGTFTLPKNIKHKGLCFVAMFPATSEEEIRKLPVQQAITYTLEYEAGGYTELLDTAKLDKRTDLQDHPESYQGFYDAVLVVAERSTKKMP